jgi:hypothetical protein
VRVRVPHDREDKRLCFHGLRAQVKRYGQTVLVVLDGYMVAMMQSQKQ